jgi:hypothetical protein
LTDTVTVRREDLETMMAYLAAGPWTPADKPGVAEAWRRLTEAKDAGLEEREAIAALPLEPPLPPGQFGRIELPGYRNHTGWITEETRFGVQLAVIRDWDGHEVAAVAVGPLCQVVYLPTPLRRPDPGPLAALPAGHYEGYYGDEGDGGPRGCDCGPGERCFECATDDEAAAAIPPQPAF